MDEERLKRFALLVSVCGVLVLFFVGDFVVDTVGAGEVLIEGEIVSLVELESGFLVTLDGKVKERVSMMLFTDHVYLKKGDYVDVVGTFEEYNGSKSLVASEVVLRS